MAKAKLMQGLHQNEYEKLQGYWFSIQNVCEALQYRINSLTGDRATSKFY